MPHLLKISEASSLALHAMALLAAAEDKLLTRGQMADYLGVSEAHLTKVLQRLSRLGFVHSVRGPLGGFSLLKSKEEITLLDVFEAIEGPISEIHCLLNKKICSGSNCVLGGLLQTVNEQGKLYLQSTTLADVASFYDLSALLDG